MKIFKYFLIIFIYLNSPIKADSNEVMISELQKGGKLIFIRHAYAPGGGDPPNFDINICETQRNLNDEGRIQSKKIGNFFFSLFSLISFNKIIFSLDFRNSFFGNNEWIICDGERFPLAIFKNKSSISFKLKFSKTLIIFLSRYLIFSFLN